MLSKSKVLVSGCSYAGTLTAWLRLKYPHLVDFVIAGSATVEETPGGMGDFFQVIADYLKKQGNKCFEKVDAATSAIASLVKAKKKDELSTLFDDDVDLKNHAKQQSFIDDKFNTPLWQRAQYGPRQLRRLCEEMANGNGTGAEIYANWFNTLPPENDNTNKIALGEPERNNKIVVRGFGKHARNLARLKLRNISFHSPIRWVGIIQPTTATQLQCLENESESQAFAMPKFDMAIMI